MKTEHGTPDKKGVALKRFSVIDPGPEIDGMVRRQLNMHMVSIEPGEVICMS